MSAAFVPGCMRRLELASMRDCSIGEASRFDCAPMEGDLGPIWISAGGGGLGSRGELGAIAIVKGGDGVVVVWDGMVSGGGLRDEDDVEENERLESILQPRFKSYCVPPLRLQDLRSQTVVDVLVCRGWVVLFKLGEKSWSGG